MKYLKVLILSVISIIASNIIILQSIFNNKLNIVGCIVFGLVVAFLVGYIPINKKYKTKKLNRMFTGCEILTVFLIVLIFNSIFFLVIYLQQNINIKEWHKELPITFVGTFEIIIFIRGMLKIYTTSTQLGIKHRILIIVLAWIPPINLCYLAGIIKMVKNEVEFENDKIILNESRKDEQICKTKYPLVLVHGIFFRDFRYFKYFNYWGRITQELLKNGAKIYYGNQESADSVENCGKQLAKRIEEIVKETGCEKVNVIAHSKGGLDSRAAISHYGADKYVATLTTINTPHYGCILADKILNRVSERFKNIVSKIANFVLKILGGKKPDFLSAVNDVTNKECVERNKVILDKEGILYESVMSSCNRVLSNGFPLNITYPIVNKYNKKNDGLVEIESAKWGSSFTLIEPSHNKYRAGISHGDMIDLNRKNIKGFDVREFYVQLVKRLKEREY